ncbi:hypothetical protein JDW21_19445 [Bacillus subtilis]|uniref:hypothetical protein n=1 Tax=Bacillus subtilis TaxID=1423 RepID=UPI002ED5CBA4
MSRKRILICFVDNGDIKHTVAKNIMLDKIEKEMKEEGKELLDKYNDFKSFKLTFKDSSTIQSVPFSHLSKSILTMGEKFAFTHVYIDDAVKDMFEGTPFMSKFVESLLVNNDARFDTNGKRVNFYSLKDSNLEIN